MDSTLPKPTETRSQISGSLRISWALSGIDPAEIQLQGVLDFVGSDALDRVVAAILNRNYRRILVDVSKLDRLTAAGAEGLLKAAAEIRRRSGRVVLVGPTANVMAFIENLGLNRQIDILDTVEAAVRTIEA